MITALVALLANLAAAQTAGDGTITGTLTDPALCQENLQ
jgi:hypothetical protein